LSYNISMKNTNTYPIRYVAQQTGLTPHLIRAWERRYGAVLPERTQSNRRLYSEEDIERLKLLRRASAAGHSMAQIAGMTTEALLEVVGDEGRDVRNRSVERPAKSGPPSLYFDTCLKKVLEFDQAGLQVALNRAAIALSRTSLIEEVIAPLVEKIGDLWSEGSLKIANEHMATAVIRSFLGDLLGPSEEPPGAPRMIVTTPAGEWHEIGALMVALEAQALGWNAFYLGPNLPAEEILSSFEQTRAKAIALSVVHVPDDFHLIRDLKKLRRYLPENGSLMMGGRAVESMKGLLEKMGITPLRDLADFREKLSTVVMRDSAT
jgi:DNA-binding transcriptional MerR regulator/methylmalonyl-CoA mutase cobalamin-binding subunit